MPEPRTQILSREQLLDLISKTSSVLELADILEIGRDKALQLEKKLRSEGFDLTGWESLSDPEALRRFNELYTDVPDRTRRFTLTHMVKFDREILPTLFSLGIRTGGFVARYLNSYNRFYRWVEESCAYCGLEKEWRGKPLTLQLHHRDGNSDNNVVENLCYACPNCHSQTENYSGRNQATFRIV